MSRFATRFKHRQHIENITDDDEFPIHLFNYPWLQQAGKIDNLQQICGVFCCVEYAAITYLILSVGAP